MNRPKTQAQPSFEHAIINIIWLFGFREKAPQNEISEKIERIKNKMARTNL